MEIKGFRGMDNVQQSTSFLVDKFGLVTPRFVFNADVTTDMALTKRAGYTKLVSLSNAHSLSTNCSVLLCIASNKLCLLTAGGYTELCDVETTSMSYVEIDGLIYMSSATWTGKYNLITEAIGDWGVALPPAPVVSVVSDGELPIFYVIPS